MAVVRSIPKKFYAPIAEVIMTWARLEADIDSHLGFSVREPSSPVHDEPLQISYSRRAKLLKAAIKGGLSEKAYLRVCNTLARIRSLKELRDAVAHGRSWIMRRQDRKAVVSTIRWYAPSDPKKLFCELHIHEFTAEELSRLAERIEDERANLLDDIDPGNSPRTWARWGEQMKQLQSESQAPARRAQGRSRKRPQRRTTRRKPRAQRASSQG